MSVWLIRRFNVNSIEGNRIEVQAKAPNYKAAYLGGTAFGCGWAMTGACPGPMYALIGSGTTVMVLAVLAGVLRGVRLRRVARQTSPLIHSVHEQLVDLA